MKLKDKYELLHEHLALLHEILNMQPNDTILRVVKKELNSVQLSQLLPKDEVIELVNYYTYSNSNYVLVLPLFAKLISTLLYKTRLHPFYQEIK